MSKLTDGLNLASRYLYGIKKDYLAEFIFSQYNLFKEIELGADYWCVTYYTPGEILALNGLKYTCIERISGFGAAMKLFNNLSDYFSEFGIPNSSCSYQLFFHLLISEKLLPDPKGFIAMSYTCNDASSYCSYASQEIKVPMYYVDIPRKLDHNSVQYISNQLKDLSEKLSSGKEKASLEQIVEVSNKTLSVKKKIDELRREYPGILSSMDSFKIFTLKNELGGENAYNIFRKLYHHLLEKSQLYKIKQKTKVLWLGVIPLYYNSFLDDIEKKYDCEIVYEELFMYPDIEISTDTFYDDLAKRIIACHFFSIESRVKELEKMVNQYEVDHIIHFTQKNCKFLGPMVPMIKNRLSKPFLELKGDVINSDELDRQKLFSQLDNFFTLKNLVKN